MMAVTGQRMTAEELLILPDDGMRHELIDGVLTTMSPSGRKHGILSLIIGRSLSEFTDTHGGEAYGAETGFLLRRNPDLLRAPDASYLRHPPEPLGGDEMGFINGPPDLAVEVRSPGDRQREVASKVADWLQYGTKLVVVVDPMARKVQVHPAGEPAYELAGDDTLDGGAAVPGWRLSLARLFR
jgi:Uma2 family endonuclease